MNENNNKKRTPSLIRAGMCIAVLVIVILSWAKIIPSDKIGITAASVILCAVSAWNAVDAVKEKRKGTAIFNFVMSAVLLLLCLAAWIL